MNGRCKDKPELVDVEMPFTVNIPVLPAPKGGELLIRKLFEPLGYELQIERHQLDEQFEEWGASRYYGVKLKNEVKLKDLLAHLYVLIPALDNDKHYYVNQSEIDKLLNKGQGWLEHHPEKAQIAKRYLINLTSLSRQALKRLEAGEETEENEAEIPDEVKEQKESLHQKRLKLVVEKLKETGAEKVIDLGCGEGKLIRMMLKERQFRKITGMDVSYTELSKCKDRLHWDEMSPRQKDRIHLFQGALTYKDKRLAGFDAAAIVEVIEHLDESRLKSFERVVFEFAQPKTVVLTTPNGEYNVLFESLTAGTMRHTDHRFEWSRQEFQDWANQVAQNNNYVVRFFPIGEEDEKVGAPSQMAIFEYGN